MKKRRIIIAVINVVVVAAMVLFDMLYMKKDKKEESVFTTGYNVNEKKISLREITVVRILKIIWKIKKLLQLSLEETIVPNAKN